MRFARVAGTVIAAVASTALVAEIMLMVMKAAGVERAASITWGGAIIALALDALGVALGLAIRSFAGRQDQQSKPA
jgi:hypothetical protein